MNKLPIAATATAVLTLALSACTSSEPAASGSARPGISHIHGLGISSDDRLYVATHEGIFTPGKNSEPRRVGTSKDDFMGFTVAEGKRFLASGHPAEGTGGPGNRGLIESTDAGRTWKTRSLAGEVDFHALDHAHDTVYGYDSTNSRLRVSEDGGTWDDRASLEALDIAVSPDDPDLVLATTGDGIAKSTDGGRTFGPGAGPVMAYVSWPSREALYGVDPSGALHRSTDGGATWKKSSTVPGGRPQALTAVDARRVLVATEDGVYESKDAGATFSRRLAVTSNSHH